VLTQTATARCEARSGVGCKNAALPGGPWCHGHDPDRAMERVRIARQDVRRHRDRCLTGDRLAATEASLLRMAASAGGGA
jgi:hypothetical protein